MVLPLWLGRFPPIQDLPQHLAAVRVLFDFSDPTLRFSEYFERTPFSTQYLAYYLLVGLLSKILPVAVANKIVLSAALIALPYSMRWLLSTLQLNRALSLLTLPLIWNAHLILGFLNFIAALPCAIGGLALALQLRLKPTRRTSLALACTGLVTFFLHVVPFAILGLGASLIAVSRKPSVMVRSALPLLPGALAAAFWFMSSAAGQATLNAATDSSDSGPKAKFQSFKTALAQVQGWITDVLPGSADDHVLPLWAVLWLLALALGVRSRNSDPLLRSLRLRIRILAPIAVAGYFLLPESYDWIWPINARFALLAALLSIPLLPRQRPFPVAAIALGAALLGVQSSALVIGATRKFQNEVGADFDEAVELIPEGSRVAALIFDRYSRAVKFAPFIHFGAYYQAEHGGALMFTFADFPQSPFRFAKNRPPKVRPRWEWTPEKVNLDRELDWYQYVLVRGGAERLKTRQFARVFRGKKWSVYERVEQ